MNTTLQSGQQMQSAHLDADQLNAFAEGALSEHERTAALAHLAECASCREVAFLAQPPEAALNVRPVAPSPTQPWRWRNWFSGSPVLGAAAAGLVCTLLLAGVVHFRYLLAPDAAPAPAQVAEQITPPVPATTTTATPPAQVAEPPKASPAPALKTPTPVTPVRSDAITPAPPRVAGAIGAAGAVVPASPAPANVNKAPAAPQPQLPMMLPGVAPSPPLPAPQHAPAVTGASRPEMARNVAATPPLQPGANTGAGDTANDAASNSANNSTQFANTINIETINALPAYDQLETRTRQVQPSKALPSKLPVASQAVSGRRTLVIDTQGSVFLSIDGGRHWRAVRAPWTGKAAQVAIAPATRQFAAQLPPPPTAAAAPAAQSQDIATMGAAVSQTASPGSQMQTNTFQLTTTTHEIWVSADGVTWRRGP